MMDRKRALAVAAMTSITVGTATLALVATIGVPILGFGATQQAAAVAAPIARTVARYEPRTERVVTRFRDTYDRVVVDRPTAAPAAAPRRAAPPAWVSPPPPAPRSVTAEPPSSEAEPHSSDGEPADDSAPPTAGSPKPPAGCRQAHLEDNGVWNCQGD